MTADNPESYAVIVLGAGFSLAATDGKLPLMRSFFDQLEKPTATELFEFIEQVSGDPREANVERILLALEQIGTSPDRALRGWGERWKQCRTTIQPQLSAYVLRRLGSLKEVDDETWAAKTLFRFAAGATIVSMNYDNVAEILLSTRPGLRHFSSSTLTTCPHCKLRLLLESACSCSTRLPTESLAWKGAIVKPHGSISWKRCVNPNCCSFECLVADRNCRPLDDSACDRCGERCVEALVMPTMSKHLDDLPEIGVMWEVTRLALAQASHLLFFGFSMPTSDELLRQVFRSALITNRDLSRVTVIDVMPDAVIDRLQSCLPSHLAPDYQRLAVIPGQIPDWLGAA